MDALGCAGVPLQSALGGAAAFLGTRESWGYGKAKGGYVEW